VLCKDSFGATAGDRCDPATKPAARQDCNRDPCPTYSWVPGEWSACSAQCGAGSQVRVLVCRDSSGGSADDLRCAGQARPETNRTCEALCQEGCTCAQTGGSATLAVGLVLLAILRRRRPVAKR